MYDYRRTAAAKYDVSQAIMEHMGKVQMFQADGLKFILQRIDKGLKGTGYGLNMLKSYIDVRIGGSENKSEGHLVIVPRQALYTPLGEEQMKQVLIDRFDLWTSLRPDGDGWAADFGG